MNTVALISAAILGVAGIVWIVIYNRKRGEKHTVSTSIRPQESQRD